jgi:hypothetical protein
MQYDEYFPFYGTSVSKEKILERYNIGPGSWNYLGMSILLVPS